MVGSNVGYLAGPLFGVIGAAVGALIVLAITFGLADVAAKKDFWTGFSASLGMSFRGEVELPTFTPILAAGDRRACEEWMEGALPDGRRCGLGNYNYETRHRDSDGGSDWTSHRFTLAHIEVAAAEAPFLRAVFLRPSRMLRFAGDQTLPRTSTDKLTTESAAFDERYDLLVGREEPKARVLELFSPSFIERMARHPLEPSFDYVAGSLVVFTDKRTSDAGGLLQLWDVTREIAARFDEEIAESRAARGDAGLR